MRWRRFTKCHECKLDTALDKIAADCHPGFPISVILQAHEFQASILLGLPESFVYLDEVNRPLSWPSQPFMRSMPGLMSWILVSASSIPLG